MLESLPSFTKESGDAGIGVPVLNDVEPALVPEQDARVVLHPWSRVVPEVAGAESERALETSACLFQVAYDDTDVLDAQDSQL